MSLHEDPRDLRSSGRVRGDVDVLEAPLAIHVIEAAVVARVRPDVRAVDRDPRAVVDPILDGEPAPVLEMDLVVHPGRGSRRGDRGRRVARIAAVRELARAENVRARVRRYRIAADGERRRRGPLPCAVGGRVHADSSIRAHQIRRARR